MSQVDRYKKYIAAAEEAASNGHHKVNILCWPWQLYSQAVLQLERDGLWVYRYLFWFKLIFGTIYWEDYIEGPTPATPKGDVPARLQAIADAANQKLKEQADAENEALRKQFHEG